LAVSKGLEFETFKIGIVDLFPDADEFEGVAISHPTVDQHVIAKFFGHVGERDEVLTVLRDNGDGCALDFDADAFGFTHVSQEWIHRGYAAVILAVAEGLGKQFARTSAVRGDNLRLLK
jgi:hypothetical protein